MELTLEQVERLSTDAGSIAAGKKLMAIKNWSSLGVSAEAVWGICRGSADYQVKFELSSNGYACSCPSRKFPCKHVLGLLMLRAVSPGAVTDSVEPAWVTDWLNKRKERVEKKAEKVAEAATVEKKPVDEKAQQRRTAQREGRVSEGLERLDIWLKDLVRTGLASLESKTIAFWEEEAKRLVDAQAPALAARVKRLAEIPRSGKDWPERLLGEFGRIKLLIEAWRNVEKLSAEMESEVRQLIGWTITQADLDQSGEKLTDTWIVLGQTIDDEDRIRIERSWLVGRDSGRTGVIWQFAPQNQPFAESITPGIEQQATLVVYPGSSAQRVKFIERSPAEPVTTRPPGCATIEEFMHKVANQLARSPWQGSFSGCLHDVTVTPTANAWYAVDTAGNALPLAGQNHARLCALTGGEAGDLACEWDGRELRPIGLFFRNTYRVLRWKR